MRRGRHSAVRRDALGRARSGRARRRRQQPRRGWRHRACRGCSGRGCAAVRSLMYSRSPISRFEHPSRTRLQHLHLARRQPVPRGWRRRLASRSGADRLGWHRQRLGDRLRQWQRPPRRPRRGERWLAQAGPGPGDGLFGQGMVPRHGGADRLPHRLGRAIEAGGARVAGRSAPRRWPARAGNRRCAAFLLPAPSAAQALGVERGRARVVALRAGDLAQAGQRVPHRHG